MKKRLLSLVLAVVMMFSVVPVMAEGNTRTLRVYGNYNINKDGTQKPDRCEIRFTDKTWAGNTITQEQIDTWAEEYYASVKDGKEYAYDYTTITLTAKGKQDLVLQPGETFEDHPNYNVVNVNLFYNDLPREEKPVVQPRTLTVAGFYDYKINGQSGRDRYVLHSTEENWVGDNITEEQISTWANEYKRFNGINYPHAFTIIRLVDKDIKVGTGNWSKNIVMKPGQSFAGYEAYEDLKIEINYQRTDEIGIPDEPVNQDYAFNVVHNYAVGDTETYEQDAISAIDEETAIATIDTTSNQYDRANETNKVADRVVTATDNVITLTINYEEIIIVPENQDYAFNVVHNYAVGNAETIAQSVISAIDEEAAIATINTNDEKYDKANETNKVVDRVVTATDSVITLTINYEEIIIEPETFDFAFNVVHNYESGEVVTDVQNAINAIDVNTAAATIDASSDQYDKANATNKVLNREIITSENNVITLMINYEAIMTDYAFSVVHNYAVGDVIANAQNAISAIDVNAAVATVDTNDGKYDKANETNKVVDRVVTAVDNVITLTINYEAIMTDYAFNVVHNYAVGDVVTNAQKPINALDIQTAMATIDTNNNQYDQVKSRYRLVDRVLSVKEEVITLTINYKRLPIISDEDDVVVEEIEENVTPLAPANKDVIEDKTTVIEDEATETMDDYTTPLAEANIGEEDIVDENTPLAAAPKTSDDYGNMVFTIIMLSLLGLAVVSIKKVIANK